MKEINNLWIWPPGGSGNFILKHYYGGKTLPNNEFVANSIKWFPKYLNVSHAEYFLQAKSEYKLPNYLYDRAKKEILAQNETDYAWHWIPVHIKDFLSVKKLFFIHAQPEDMWFTSFLTQIKNVNTGEINEWAQDLLFPTSMETLNNEYNHQLNELKSFPSDEIFVTDYRDLFFEYKQDTLDFYMLDKNDVQDYTTKNIELIKTFIKEKLNPDLHEVFLNKIVDLQA